MKDYLYKNEEWLRYQAKKYKTLSDICKNTGYPMTSVKRYCDRFGIKLETKRKSTERVTKGFLIDQYSKGKEIREIAKEFKLSTKTIVLKNREFGISATDYNPKYLYKNKEWLEEQFKLYGNISNVAKKSGYPRTCISRYSQKYGIYEKQFTREKENYVDEHYFDEVNTPTKAYFLGFIMADGNIYKYKSNDKIQFSLKIKSTDIDILYKLADEIQFNKEKITTRTRLRKGTKTYSSEIKSYNKNFCNNLVKHGIIPCKSGHESIPYTIPNEYKKDFIRGYIDGDGWVLINSNCIGVCSESKEVIEDIVDYLSGIVEITTAIRKDKTVYSFRITRQNSVAKVCDHLYYEGCISLDRKYNNARKLVQQYLK